MYRTFVAAIGSVTLFAASLLPAGSFAQVRTELRDPMRGVSFHSVELDDSALNALDVIDGSFPDSDRLVVGLSAMTFDGSDVVDSYVLWIRHEGRRWLDFERTDPVEIAVGGEVLAFDRLRASQPFVGASGRLFEKIEFALSEADVMRLAASSDATITLRSDNGNVRKRLSAEERAYMRKFTEQIRAMALVDRIS
jgi:hypothetical protein